MLELAPMKNGISVLGRFLLCFLAMEVLFILLLASGPFLESARGKAPFSPVLWKVYALESVPLAVAVSVYYAGFAATRKLRRRVSGYFLLWGLSLALLCGGVLLSRGVPIPSGSSPAAENPETEAPAPALPYFVRETSGDTASGIVYVREEGEKPRLAWASSGAYSPEKGALIAGRVSLPLAGTRRLVPVSPVPELRDFRRWYLGLGRESLPLALAAATGIAFLLCGLWPLSRMFSWPLIGAMAAGAALLSLGFLHGALTSPSLRSLADLVGLKLPASMMAGILSGACGLSLTLLDFLFRPPLEGADTRRRRGRA